MRRFFAFLAVAILAMMTGCETNHKVVRILERKERHPFGYKPIRLSKETSGVCVIIKSNPNPVCGIIHEYSRNRCELCHRHSDELSRLFFMNNGRLGYVAAFDGLDGHPLCNECLMRYRGFLFDTQQDTDKAYADWLKLAK